MQNKNVGRLRSVVLFSFCILYFAFCIPVLRGADLPDVLPYGVDDLPGTPVVRVNVTSPRAVELLGGRINDPYLPARVEALTAIGQCELPAGAGWLRKGFADTDPQARAAAAAAAGHVGDPSLTADLKPLLHDPDARVRRAAVLSGVALGDTTFADAGLADTDATVVAAAVSVATASQADKLAASLAGYPVGTQVLAIRSLGRLGDAGKADLVGGYLTAALPLKVAAIQSLGQMKATAKSAEVLKLLADEHPTVRRVAVLALPTLVSADERHARAITALADADLPVREAAARVLTDSPSPDAVAALVSNLSTDSLRVHDASRAALIATGQPALPAIVKLLTDSNPRRREDGSYLLGRLKSDASLDGHIALLTDSDVQVVRQAADSLGRIGRREALPELNKLALRGGTEPVESPLGVAIEPAIVACAQFGDQSILPMCKAVMPQKKTVAPTIRSAAAFAIGRLGQPGDKSYAGMLTHPIGDQEDAGIVQFECLKALGQLKLPAIISIVGKTREESTYSGDPKGDWVCYWIRSRVLGPQPPLTPIEEKWEAATSPMPLSK